MLEDLILWKSLDLCCIFGRREISLYLWGGVWYKPLCQGCAEETGYRLRGRGYSSSAEALLFLFHFIWLSIYSHFHSCFLFSLLVILHNIFPSLIFLLFPLLLPLVCMSSLSFFFPFFDRICLLSVILTKKNIKLKIENINAIRLSLRWKAPILYI